METIHNAPFLSRSAWQVQQTLADLSLADVVAVRSSRAWLEYAAAVDELLRRPWLMSHPTRGLTEVLRRYGKLLRSIVGGGFRPRREGL
jgi:hypothetical protein